MQIHPVVNGLAGQAVGECNGLRRARARARAVQRDGLRGVVRCRRIERIVADRQSGAVVAGDRGWRKGDRQKARGASSQCSRRRSAAGHQLAVCPAAAVQRKAGRDAWIVARGGRREAQVRIADILHRHRLRAAGRIHRGAGEIQRGRVRQVQLQDASWGVGQKIDVAFAVDSRVLNLRQSAGQRIDCCVAARGRDLSDDAMAIPIGDKDVAVAIHRNAIEAGELGRGAAQRLDRGVVARGRDLLDGAMARVADKNIVIGVDGDGVRLAEATAQRRDGRVPPSRRNLVHRIVACVGNKKVSGAIYCDAIGIAELKAGGQLIDRGVSARCHNLVYRVLVLRGDEEVSRAVHCYAIGAFDAFAESGGARAARRNLREHVGGLRHKDIAVAVDRDAGGRAVEATAAQRALRGRKEGNLRPRARALQIGGSKHVSAEIGQFHRAIARTGDGGLQGYIHRAGGA